MAPGCEVQGFAARDVDFPGLCLAAAPSEMVPVHVTSMVFAYTSGDCDDNQDRTVSTFFVDTPQ